MKKQPLGLFIEGSFTSSILLRLQDVTADLGPIKSSSLQVARRVSNFLRNGYAVTSLSDLFEARMILIRVPDNCVERAVSEFVDLNLNLREHTVVLCETWTPTDALDPIKYRGARVASLVSLPTVSGKTFGIEGDPIAVRQVRRLVERSEAAATEFRPGSKHLLFAAAVLCAAAPTPLYVLAQQALRDAGMSGKQANSLVEQMSVEAVASFVRGARAPWGGPLASSLESSQAAHWSQLDHTHADLSQTLKSLVHWSRDFMHQKRKANLPNSR